MHLRCFIEEEGKVLDSSHKGTEKGGCVSSKQMKSEPQCLRNGKRSSQILSCPLPAASRNADKEYHFRIAKI